MAQIMLVGRAGRRNGLGPASTIAGMQRPVCPLCAAEDVVALTRHSVALAVRHFEIGYGLRDRGGRLRATLERLWAPDDGVTVQRCERCGFGFAWPHVAGDADFYNLVTGGTSDYPQHRWEFGRTVAELARLSGGRGKVRVLESGAGDGAFLAQARDTLGDRLAAIGVEVDRGSVARIRERCFEAVEGTLSDVAADATKRGRFDAICLFQTLEHLDRPYEVRAAILSLLAPRGHVFLSVPNPAAIAEQERHTGFFDMPPNHVGRWGRGAFVAWTAGAPLAVVDEDFEPADPADRAAARAREHVMADRYRRASWTSLVHRLPSPVAIDLLTKRRRGRLERAALRDGAVGEPATYWVHLVGTG
jgi:SAM-dependent methyltransferase